MSRFRSMSGGLARRLRPTTFTGTVPPSFTWKAFATLVLYCIFWFPGLLANILFYGEAKNAQQRTGHAPEGMGCLGALLWLNLLIPLAILALLFMLGFIGAATRYGR
jgi:hypothetical protein